MMLSDDLSRDQTGLQAGRPATLDLLRPQDLPPEILPDPEDAQILRETLAEFLDALATPEHRALRVRALLLGLGSGAGQTAGIEATGIPAKRDEVEDFDRYFGVRRVAADAPAMALLRGMLQTACAVLALIDRAPDLPQEPVARQIEGFDHYARLLGRICGVAT